VGAVDNGIEVARLWNIGLKYLDAMLGKLSLCREPVLDKYGEQTAKV
jgi:hypothetical protein